MFIKPLFLIGLVLIIIASILFVFSCGRRYHHRGHWMSTEKKAEWFVNRISKELDLHENQKTKLEQIKDELLAKKLEFKGTKAEIQDEIMSQIRNDSVDQEQLNEFFEDNETKLKDMRSFLVAKFAEFHSILTPEQKDKLAEKLEKFRGRYGR